MQFRNLASDDRASPVISTGIQGGKKNSGAARALSWVINTRREVRKSLSTP